MKKLTLIIAIVFSGMLMQAQNKDTLKNPLIFELGIGPDGVERQGKFFVVTGVGENHDVILISTLTGEAMYFVRTGPWEVVWTEEASGDYMQSQHYLKRDGRYTMLAIGLETNYFSMWSSEDEYFVFYEK